MIRKFEKNIDVNFLIQILSSELIQKQYKRLAAGGVVSNISSELVYAVKVDLPSIPEQQKIATVLTSADKEIELLDQQLADLQQKNKDLQQQNESLTQKNGELQQQNHDLQEKNQLAAERTQVVLQRLTRIDQMDS